MIDMAAYIEGPWQRSMRWSGSAAIIAAAYAGVAVFAFLFWPVAEPRSDTPPGAIMIDLAALAEDSQSDQQEMSEQPMDQKAAPPPSPTDAKEQPEEQKAAETPPSPQPEQAPAEQQPEAAAEPVREATPDTPPVEEAPLAPEPEVALPKQEPVKQEPVKEAVEQPRERPKKKPAEKPTPEKSEKAPTSKASKKSDSPQQKQAAASASGSFNPNPIYRPKPAYPSGARAQKIQGYVVVAYTVSPSGAVTGARVVSASPAGVFNGASVAAVRQWRFKPSAKGGSRSTTIRFKL